jgi:hypothetical protein
MVVRYNLQGNGTDLVDTGHYPKPSCASLLPPQWHMRQHYPGPHVFFNVTFEHTTLK